MKQLSVIVPVVRAANLPEILASYLRQDLEPEAYDVIFVAAGDADDVLQAITTARDGGPWITTRHEAVGNCVARNRAAAAADGNIILFIDGDQVIHHSLFRAHVKAHQEHLAATGRWAVGMGICNIDLRGSGGYSCVALPWARGWHWEMGTRFTRHGDLVEGLTLNQAIGFAMFHNPNKLDDYVNMVGRNCSFPAGAFQRMGGFDEAMDYSPTSPSRGWEDLEISLRAHCGGLDHVLVPSWTAHIAHDRQFPKEDKGFGNLVHLCRKHPWFLAERQDWFALRGGDSRVRAALEKGGA